MSNEQTKQYLADARKQLNIAEHMLITTYPVVNDPKLLLGVVETLQTSLKSSLQGFLTNERFMRNVPAFSTSIDGMLAVFSVHSQRKHKFTTNITELFTTLDETLSAHKDASVAFTKDNKFNFADNKMNIKSLSVQQTKELLAQTKVACKELIDKTEVFA